MSEITSKNVVDLIEDIFLRRGAESYLGEQVTICLLYTSPSPRDGLLSRMPSSA